MKNILRGESYTLSASCTLRAADGSTSDMDFTGYTFECVMKNKHQTYDLGEFFAMKEGDTKVAVAELDPADTWDFEAGSYEIDAFATAPGGTPRLCFITKRAIKVETPVTPFAESP